MDRKEIFRRIEEAEKGSEILNLSKCGLTSVPSQIFKLNHLKQLYLSHNNIYKIPDSIGSLKNLERLDFAFNKIQRISSELSGLTNLKTLSAAGNQISNLSPDIKYNKNLTLVTLINNLLENLPSEIGCLQKIEIFSLRWNRLTELPREIGNMVSLKEIWLADNNLTQLPYEIQNLVNLRLADFQGNPLNIPSEIIKLKQEPKIIFDFYFHNIKPVGICSIKADPAAISMKDSKILDLKKRDMEFFPSDVLEMDDLEQLHLQGNRIKEIPRQIKKLSKLTLLDLSGNLIEVLPPYIKHLKKISALLLAYNSLDSLPSEITELENLEWLSFRFNNFKAIPFEICEIKKLRHLDARNNLIASLPHEIGNLINLLRLDLENNKIKTLPFEIQNLSQLVELDLRGNPLPIPPEILELTRSPKKILDYYFKTRLETAKPLNEAKVLILGQGAVGKTSLIKRLIDNTFNPHENQTDGINIRHWHINSNGENIRLNIWDFGGQEIMHATHQFFLTKRSLYVLVLDSRLDDQENRVEYWLQIIQSFGGNSPVILVCNKCDERCLDLNWKRLKEKYPSIKAFVKRASCKTGENIDELRSVIETEAARLDHVHDPLILTWFAVKSRLEGMEEDYISYRRYQTMCEEENIPDDISRETLIGFLHDLGIVLHFRDHPILEDTNVLNPEWVTRGVYKILNSHILFQKSGKLDRGDLNDILDPVSYPRNRHQFIIDMMRQFELCFDFEGGDRFLVPDLLQKEEPDTGDWNGGLGFQYRYEILPGSVISRFIVRMHTFISKRTYWKNGVVLKSDDGKNRALVRADIEDRTISISVDGRESARREFLAVIRADFRKIHATIPGLGVTEIVTLPDRPDIAVEYQYLKDLEEMGEESFIPPGLKQRVNVKQLLNGVESEDARKKDETAYPGIGNVTILQQRGDINMGDNININSEGDAAFAKDQGSTKVDGRTENFSGNFAGSAIVTGDGNTVTVNYQKAELPPAESVDMPNAVAELKKILAELGAPDGKKIERAIEDAGDELKKDEPDKDEVGEALERALKYSEKADKFKLAVDKLKPHVTDASAWLGENWHKLLGFVGLA